jgi:hypothetical protein
MARGEWQSTTELVNAAIQILMVESPMTIRQLFYRLVSAAVIGNCLRDYQRVSKAMTKARDDGRVDYDWIVDRSRATYRPGSYKNLADFGKALENACKQYRMDYWQDQPSYVEIWCEKDAVTGSIDEVRRQYGVTVEAQRGFNSTTNVHNVAQRLLDKKSEGKHLHVLYVGDWDPSGEEIQADVERRVKPWQYTANACVNLFDFHLYRVAIFKDDIRTFNLPPLRVKTADSRAAKFLRRHGDYAVELDALPPTELRARLRRAIEKVIDHSAWDRALMVEEGQRQTCQRYGTVLSQMIPDSA